MYNASGRGAMNPDESLKLGGGCLEEDYKASFGHFDLEFSKTNGGMIERTI